jgi:hypothetical protein
MPDQQRWRLAFVTPVLEFYASLKFVVSPTSFNAHVVALENTT